MSTIEQQTADRPVTLSEVVAAEYESLHQIAACCFLHERTDHTLQATAVLHEAYLSVSDSVRDTPGPRIYYLAAMARGIRQVLARHARSRNAIKRNGGALITERLPDATDDLGDPQERRCSYEYDAWGRLTKIALEKRAPVEFVINWTTRSAPIQ